MVPLVCVHGFVVPVAKAPAFLFLLQHLWKTRKRTGLVSAKKETALFPDKMKCTFSVTIIKIQLNSHSVLYP
jgi:hypothetical protein